MTTATSTAVLIEAARSAALKISRTEDGPYHGTDGVGVEIFLPNGHDGDGDWFKLDELSSEDQAGADAVRLFDYEGNRGSECRTVVEVEANVADWLN